MLRASSPANEYWGVRIHCLINYLTNICERLLYNNWIWFIAYWVGRQSNEITFWNEREILNASFYFVSIYYCLGFKWHGIIWQQQKYAEWEYECVCVRERERERNKSRLSNSLFSWYSFRAIAVNDLRIYAVELCLFANDDLTFPVSLLNHFQWAPDLLIPKRTGGQIKWNLRECYYVIKNILKRTIVGKPQMICQCYTKKVG